MAATYRDESITIDEPAILFRLSRTYDAGVSKEELKEATRGVWKVGERRYGATYAFAVYYGIIREVYKIEDWDPAGTTPYKTRRNLDFSDRWEFVGDVAEEAIRTKYINKSVDYFKPRSSNVFTYVNC